MKIFFHAFDAAGHVNACLGVAQALAQRGHQIMFVIGESFAGKIASYGFKEILLKTSQPDHHQHDHGHRKRDHVNHGHSNQSDHAKNDHGHCSGDGIGMWDVILSNRSSLEKADHLKHLISDKVLAKFVDFEPQFAAAVEREKPDLIVADMCHFMILPSILHSKVPWVLIHSSNPLLIYNSPDLPPHSSGYSTTDRSEWSKFDVIKEEARKNLEEYQNRLLKHFGYPEVKIDTLVSMSPYLNVYGYPAELDYTDLVAKPDNFFRIDAFARVIPEPFYFPAEFTAKFEPGRKLIYISMGTMASRDVQLLKKVVGTLGNTPHLFVVVRGPHHDQYQLGSNMWGEEYLPQTSILAKVDAVITHGGNNTITEAIHHGKPMVVMPVNSDQFDNAQRIVEKGFGLRIEPYDFEPSQLVRALEHVLTDTDMHHRITSASKRMAAHDTKQQLCKVLEELPRKH